MNPDPHKPLSAEAHRRKREKALIIFLVLILAALVYIEKNFPALPSDLPLSNNVIVFALININIILLLLLVFLIVRNTLKLLLERKRKIVGFRLRSKLSLAFVSLSLIPTLLLFITATGFIRYSIDNWFSVQFESALDASLEIAQDYYRILSDQSKKNALHIADEITRKGLLIGEARKPLQDYLEQKRNNNGFTAIVVYTKKGYTPLATSCSREFNPDKLHRITSPNDSLFHLLSRVVPLNSGGSLIQGSAPVFSVWKGDKEVAVVIVSRFVSANMNNNLDAVSQKFSSYKQTKSMKQYIKYSYVLSFVLITVLIIFISLWFGFYLAKNITEPLQELALATRKIAGGELDFTIDMAASDEIGILVQSFNEMTERLKASTQERELANSELIKMNDQLEQRRKYIEVILKNVNAGIITLDRNGKIITINETAATLFDLREKDCYNKNYREIFTSEIIRKIRFFLKNQGPENEEPESREIELSLPERSIHLAVNFTRLNDDQNNYIGMLIIINDLTEIINAQKAVAWREVARRIAHEIKNPLTPIALSAERIRRKYSPQLIEGDEVLHNCTSTIIKQVGTLKELVNEFSNFARMPQAKSIQVRHPDIQENQIDIFLVY